MMWEKVTLGEVTDSCLGKMLDKEKNKGELQPYLANINVRWGSFDLDNLPQMRFEEHEQDRYGLKYGDLIICEGGEPGRCAIWKEELPNMKIQKALHRVRVRENLDYRYLFYWFLYAGKRHALDQYYTGSTIKHLPGDKLRKIEIDLHPLPTQERIASILSAYDSLIETNRRQIKLLEEAAQRLYKEWFVHLRFPGWEETKIVDGTPEGWTLTTLGDLCARIESGSRPKGGIDSSIITGIPSVGAENVLGLGRYNFESEKLIPIEYYQNMNKGKIVNRDILVYKDGAYIGKTSLFQDGFPHSLCAVNEHVFLIHARVEIVQYYLFFTLYRKEYYLKMQSLNKNAAQPGINSKAIASLPVMMPKMAILKEYEYYVTPLMSKLFCLAKQNKIATESRDRLLPKLMTGEIEV